MEINTDKREELLKLDKERKKLEEKIASLTEFLNGPGMPGVDGSLIDRDGFPKPGLDHVTIRTVRHDLICTQNDLKNLMEKIENWQKKRRRRKKGNRARERGRSARK